MASLEGKKVAVLVTGGVEEVELVKPVEFLRSKGAQVTVITPKREELEQGIPTINGVACGSLQHADALLSDVQPEQFDALFIPGGYSPDRLRLVKGAIAFVQAFAQADKPIFALCHGPQLLVNAGLLQGHTITSWPSLEVDMKNAGALWVNEQVVTDNNLVTSRMPQDIPAFDDAMEKLLSRSGEQRRAA